MVWDYMCCSLWQVKTVKTAGGQRQWVLDGLSPKTGMHTFVHQEEEFTVAQYFENFKGVKYAPSSAVPLHLLRLGLQLQLSQIRKSRFSQCEPSGVRLSVWFVLCRC